MIIYDWSKLNKIFKIRDLKKSLRTHIVLLQEISNPYPPTSFAAGKSGISTGWGWWDFCKTKQFKDEVCEGLGWRVGQVLRKIPSLG